MFNLYLLNILIFQNHFFEPMDWRGGGDGPGERWEPRVSSDLPSFLVWLGHFWFGLVIILTPFLVLIFSAKGKSVFSVFARISSLKLLTSIFLF